MERRQALPKGFDLVTDGVGKTMAAATRLGSELGTIKKWTVP